MTCSDVEILLCDYTDGLLPPAGRTEIEQHLRSCPACAEMAQDARAAVAFMERSADVDAPPELITRILFNRPQQLQRAGGLRGWFRTRFAPMLQPRFAMGMAMTIFSVAMLAKFVTPVRQLRPSDLNPTRVWASVEDRAARSWERSVKFYESIKFVYQIQSRLHEWNQEQEAEQQRQNAEQNKAPSRIDEHRVDVKQPAAPAVEKK